MKKNCPFNYAGSKSSYIKLFNIDRPVVDLFGGGGGFWSNVKASEIWVNDINTDLINFQRIIYKSNTEEVLEICDKVEKITSRINDRESFEQLRSKFNENRNPILFYSLLSTCTNNLIRYNKSNKFNQTWGKRKFNPSMKENLINFHKRIKNKRITFTSLHFSDVLPGPDFLYFADPPYLISSAGYNSIWTEEQELHLYRYLSTKQFILTNYLTKGDAKNEYLAKFIKEYPFDVLRRGKMMAQKNDNNFTEICVYSSVDIQDSINHNENRLKLF